jgi:hypothetical protein
MNVKLYNEQKPIKNKINMMDYIESVFFVVHVVYDPKIILSTYGLMQTSKLISKIYI